MSSTVFASSAASLGFEESTCLWESSFGHEDSILGSLGHPDEIDDGLGNDLFSMEMVTSLDQPLVLTCGQEEGRWDTLEDYHKAHLLNLPSSFGGEDGTDYGEEEEDKAEEAPRTPSPKPARKVVQNKAHEITPELCSQPKVKLPDTTELELQYRRTLKRLSKSMRRTDETRGIVKRQRLSKTDRHCNFFQSSKAKVMEESRQKLYRLIVTGF